MYTFLRTISPTFNNYVYLSLSGVLQLPIVLDIFFSSHIRKTVKFIHNN